MRADSAPVSLALSAVSELVDPLDSPMIVDATCVSRSVGEDGRRRALERGNRRFAVHGFPHLRARALEHSAHQGAELRMVVDDEDGEGHATSSCRKPVKQKQTAGAFAPAAASFRVMPALSSARAA